VVQKHAASRLHYDFRLELNGTLKSWAVPKGPSLNPKERRLAVEVEDHPVEYGDFEGVIPEGQYGGGTVMLWDQGTWEPLGDAEQGMREGRLKFILHGQRLRGQWSLARMSGRGEAKPQWLLIKHRDEQARIDETSITEEHLDSIASHRSMDQIAQDRKRVWQSDREPSANSKSVKKTRRASISSKSSTNTSGRPRVILNVDGIAGAVKSKLPESLLPQLPLLVTSVPAGDQWLHELKLDGYRLLCFLERGRVRMMTRGEQNWTRKFPLIAAALQSMPIDSAIIDGEVIARASDGTSTFQNLQNAMRKHTALEFHAFDLPHAQGFDLCKASLVDRKAALRQLLERTVGLRHAHVRFSDHAQGQGHELWQAACNQAMEGLVSKQAQSAYLPGRSGLWVKTKCLNRQEFVIGGFTDPEGSREGFGALLLGYYEGDELQYAGRVGTGFDTKELQRLHKKFQGLGARTSHFAAGMTTAEKRGAHWMRPNLVAEVEFSQWTQDSRLRTPVYQGLRGDKSPREIGREKPASSKAVSAPPPSSDTSTNKNSMPPASAPPRKNPTRTASKRTAPAAKLTVATVAVSSPDRVVFAASDFSKGDLAKYYGEIAEWMLPHVKDRPLTLVRCPEGSSKQCFYQKHVAGDLPLHVKGITIREERKAGRYMHLREASGLVALVQMGVLEIHTWGCRVDDIERPDRLVFDLDPGPDVSWKRVVEGAHDTRDILKAAKLESFVQTSGGKGLHVVVPLKPEATWEQAKNFAKTIAMLMEQREPRKYVSVMTKAKRTGRIFVDYLRNGRGATAISPYSTRAKPTGAVATPVTWKELARVKSADAFDALNVPRRLAKLNTDPWAAYFTLKQRLPREALTSA